MEGIVFIPGIFGTSLYFQTDGGAAEQIWPPGPLDAIFGYQSLSELSDPNRVTVGNIVDFLTPPFLPEYNAIEIDLRDISNKINSSTNGPYLPVPYDWRLDLFSAAKFLEQQVSQWADGAGLTSITFVAHSMGGLVLRLLLENVIPAQQTKPQWLPLAKRAVFACTPHLGAPKALVYGFGVDGELTLSGAQFKQFAADAHFPSGYELFPSSARHVLFDQQTGAWIAYDAANVVGALGLSPANIKKVQEVRAVLSAVKPPGAIEYFFMYGTGLDTIGSLDVEGLTLTGAKTQPDAGGGDGTVPAWSITEAANSATPPIPLWSGPGEHTAILSTDGFRTQLYSYFGLSAAHVFVAAAPALPTVAVHADKRQYAPGDSMHVLLIPTAPTETLSGTVSIVALPLVAVGAAPAAPGPTVASKYVSLQGGPIKTHSLRLDAPAMPGAYQLAFTGAGATHASRPNEGSWFFVRGGAGFPARGVMRRS